MPESFVFYRSFLEAAEKIPEKYQMHFIKSIIFYALDGAEPDFSTLPNAVKPLFEMAMIGIKPNINASNRRREASIANGKKGGAPKGNQNAQKQQQNNLKQPRNNLKQPNSTQEQPKTTKNNPNVNVNKNVNANANLHSLFTNKECCASPPEEVGVSASSASKPNGLSQEELELARKLMPIYE